MSASEIRANALQRGQTARTAQESGGVSVQADQKPNVLKFNGRVLDFRASYSDHP